MNIQHTQHTQHTHDMHEPMLFKKKPIIISALQWTGANLEAVKKFVPNDALVVWSWGNDKDAQIYIRTLEGKMKVDKEDWIIKGVKGEFYPCKPDIFEQTYDILPNK